MKRAVFLDRDGVINKSLVRNGKSYPPVSLEELSILPGVPKAIRALHEAGFLVVVVTNQPDVATGVQRRDVVETMHRNLRHTLLLDDIKVCYHTDADNCPCRKPKPGMLLEAAQELNIDLVQSFMVGDRWRDVDAGKAVGCYTFFIDYGYKEQKPKNPDSVVASLKEASKVILYFKNKSKFMR
jgi:D-glycero-D-manno-heptose 1,7-bisphosphate phosphatase